MTVGQTTAEQFASLYAAFNARDTNSLLAAMTPDVDWPNGMEGGRVIGTEAVRAYWTRQWAAVDPRVEPVRATEDDAGRVVVEVRQIVRDHSGAVLVNHHRVRRPMPDSHVLTFRPMLQPQFARSFANASSSVAMLPEFDLTAATPVGAAFLAECLPTYRAAAAYVQALPYGRPVCPDPLAVLREGRGTCSSKHALLVELAHAHGRDEVELVAGMFMMCEANTPGVGTVLAQFDLEAVPEVHCWLRVRDGSGREQRVDLTGLPAGDESPFEALADERVVEPADLSAWKPAYHRWGITDWATRWGFEPTIAWAAREACIAALMAERAGDAPAPTPDGLS